PVGPGRSGSRLRVPSPPRERGPRDLGPRRAVGVPAVRVVSGPDVVRGTAARRAGSGVDPSRPLHADHGADPAPRRSHGAAAAGPVPQVRGSGLDARMAAGIWRAARTGRPSQAVAGPAL